MASSYTTSPPSLFVDDAETNGALPVLLSSLDTVYAIDISGSTSGSILANERASAEQLSQFLPAHRIIAWNYLASVKGSFQQLTSSAGGTFVLSFKGKRRS